MALKWLNRLSSLLQHLFDLRAIKTEMIMMMMRKVFIRIYTCTTTLFLLVEPYLTVKLTYLK